MLFSAHPSLDFTKDVLQQKRDIKTDKDMQSGKHYSSTYKKQAQKKKKKKKQAQRIINTD